MPNRLSKQFLKPGMVKRLLISIASALLSTGWALSSNFLLETAKPQPRIDYSLGFVFYEERIDSTLIALSDIITFDSYLTLQIKKAIKKLWQQNAQQAMRQEAVATGGKGLVPVIDIPVKIPVFGEGSKIDIGGSDEITFGGRNTFMSGSVAQDVYQRPSFLPELKMEQKLQVLLEGTIGNRMHILIDHDSQRETEAKNKIQLKYTGDPDEILQDVEMGDTQLNIPTTGYVGSLPTHKGLFGIAAKTKLAGLDLYTIASREEGAGLSAEFTGTTQVSTDTIYDSDFLRKKFFYIPAPRGQIQTLWVYVDNNNPYQLEGKLKGIALLSPWDTTDIREKHSGFFLLKQTNLDYIFNDRENILEFTGSLDQGNVLAVRYKLKDGTMVGDVAYQDSLLLLQLIYPQYPGSQSLCWNLELKNTYYVGEGVTLDTVRIFRNEAGKDIKPELEDAGPNKGKTFVRLLGLDPNGDGVVEYPEYQRGYLFFPCSLRFSTSDRPDTVIYPFASAELLSKPDPIIYEKDRLEEGQGRGYFILAKALVSRPSFDLGSYGITENSERVLVNNVEQKKNVDYSIDYAQGIVIFSKPLPPNADVRISYEHTPLFAISQKSLLGARAELTFLEKGKLGYSIFYRSEGVPGERPTLGSEPYKRVVNELDLSYSAEPRFITRALDWLPLLHTDAPSSFSIRGDAALSAPNPNIRGATYIDDFEGGVGYGTSIAQELGVDYYQWHHASVPVNKDTTNFALTPLVWFNPPAKIKKSDVFGSDIGEEAKDLIPYLKVVFAPDNTTSWAGLMIAPPTGVDLTDYENFEAVLKTNTTHGKIHLSYGTYINEDAPRRDRNKNIVGLNGRHDYEDTNNNGQLDVNQLLNEDVGLDRKAGADASWPNIAGDDGNDDYSASANPNGTEKNNRLDNEDLDRNGFSTNNDYFEVTVDLDSAKYFQTFPTGWRLLRIPIRDTSLIVKVGSPKIEYTNLVRVWFDDFPAKDTIQLVSLNFTGSKWKNRGVSPIPGKIVLPVDSTEKVEVASVSKKTDTSYTSPFRLTRDPLTGYEETEASLELKYTVLKSLHRALVQRNTFQREDYREYQQLKIYLHNDLNDPVFFLRLGTDTANFYEYHNTISAGTKIVAYGDGKWYEFEINLDSLPSIKSNHQSSPNYSVQGNPSLAEIGYMALGIENRTSLPMNAGAVWFDDVRLTEPRRNLGTGLQTQISLALADLATLNFTYLYTDPNFKSFNDPRGVKTGGFAHQVGLTTRFDLSKFLPTSLQYNIPISYTRNQGRTTPKFSPYINDLLLDPTEAAKELGTTNSENMNITVSKGRSQNKFLNYTLDAIAFNWLQSRAFTNSTLNVDSSLTNAAGIQYSITPSLKFKGFSFLPQAIGWSIGRAGSYGTSYSRLQRDSSLTKSRSEQTQGATAGINLRYAPYQYLNTNFNLTQNRNLGHPIYLQGINIGKEQERNVSSGASLQLPISTVVNQPNLSYQANYAETQPLTADLKSITNSGIASLRVGLDPFDLVRLLTKLRNEKRDTAAAAGPLQWVALNVDKFTRSIQPVSISFTRSNASGYQGISTRPNWQYQLGLTDSISDTLYSSSSQKQVNNVDISSGATFGNFNIQALLNHSLSDNSYWGSTSRSRSTTWPSVTMSLGRLERFFKKFASSSNLNSGYAVTLDETGVPGQIANQTTKTRAFLPLISWQTQWQRRIATEIKSELTATETALSSASVTKGNEQRTALSVGYSFSAPQGIKFPGLQKLRFTSDLNLQLTLSYVRSQSTLYSQAQTIPQRNDENIDTQLSATYNFSQSVEGGLRAGYTIYNNRQTNLKSRTVDLNFSVKFRF